MKLWGAGKGFTGFAHIMTDNLNTRRWLAVIDYFLRHRMPQAFCLFILIPLCICQHKSILKKSFLVESTAAWWELWLEVLLGRFLSWEFSSISSSKNVHPILVRAVLAINLENLLKRPKVTTNGTILKVYHILFLPLPKLYFCKMWFQTLWCIYLCLIRNKMNKIRIISEVLNFASATCANGPRRLVSANWTCW